MIVAAPAVKDPAFVVNETAEVDLLLGLLTLPDCTVNLFKLGLTENSKLEPAVSNPKERPDSEGVNFSI